MEPYYLAYEHRYNAVHAAGVSRWGHADDDPGLVAALTDWVQANDLRGKRVVEFMCGEGASGVILSQLGCDYTGVDVSPAAVRAARESLSRHPNARAMVCDAAQSALRSALRSAMRPAVDGGFDGALDVMGLHMLVADPDRAQYLRNAFSCLKPGAPMLFFRESHRANAYEGPVASFEDWLALTGDDYATPQPRTAHGRDGEVEVLIALLPARARTLTGYAAELQATGFVVERAEALPENDECPLSAAIWARKPR